MYRLQRSNMLVTARSPELPTVIVQLTLTRGVSFAMLFSAGFYACREIAAHRERWVLFREVFEIATVKNTANLPLRYAM